NSTNVAADLTAATSAQRHTHLLHTDSPRNGVTEESMQSVRAIKLEEVDDSPSLLAQKPGSDEETRSGGLRTWNHSVEANYTADKFNDLPLSPDGALSGSPVQAPAPNTAAWTSRTDSTHQEAKAITRPGPLTESTLTTIAQHQTQTLAESGYQQTNLCVKPVD